MLPFPPPTPTSRLLAIYPAALSALLRVTGFHTLLHSWLQISPEQVTRTLGQPVHPVGAALLACLTDPGSGWSWQEWYFHMPAQDVIRILHAAEHGVLEF